MPTIKGILHFPTVFTPKVAQGATEAKFSIGVLLPPNDPQIPALQQEVEQAKLNSFPTGYTGQDECLNLYEVKIPPSKDYHDPRFVGYYLFTCTAKADDRPAVVDMNRQSVVDPSAVFSGMIGYVSAGISGYTKGKGGIGGWLNGVMITEEAPPMGRLDGKPSVDQMFANVGNIQTGAIPAPGMPPQQMAPPQMPPQQMAPPQMPPQQMAPPQMPPQQMAPPPAPPQPATQLIMTAAANGQTYEQYKATGWTDEQMIANGIAQRPTFA